MFLLFLKTPALYTILLEITAWVDLVKVWSILPLTCEREVKKTPNLTSLGFSVILHFSVSCFWNSGCQHRAELDGAGPWWNGYSSPVPAPGPGCQYCAEIDGAGCSPAHKPAPVSLRLPIGQNPVTAKAQQPRAFSSAPPNVYT